LRGPCPGTVLALKKLDALQVRHVTSVVNMMTSAMMHNLDSLFTFFSNSLSENMTKREAVVAEREALDTRMAAAMEEGKMNAWKRKGMEKKEPATVQALTKEIAANQAKMAALIHEAAPAQRFVDTFARWDLEASTMHEWSSSGYTKPEPEHIRQREQTTIAHLRTDCVPIRFDPEHPLWSPSREADRKEPTEAWTSITPAAYLETLNPKVEKKVEEVVPVHSGSGTPAWMHVFRPRS